MAFTPLNLPLPGHDGEEVEHIKTIQSKASEFGALTKVRIRAIDVLFEADARQVNIVELAEARTRTSTAQTTLPERSKELAELYAANADQIDDLISTHSEAWQLKRMPAVDRAILRMGAAEIMHTDTDSPILMKEYTRIAAELSTDNSASFVNALLQRIVDMKELLS